MMESESVLITVFGVECGVGTSRCLARALFENLKNVGGGVLTRLLNMTNNNGSNVKATVGHLIQLINTEVG